MKMLRLAALLLPVALACTGGEMRECLKLCHQLMTRTESYMECADKCIADCQEPCVCASKSSARRALQAQNAGAAGQCLATQVMELQDKVDLVYDMMTSQNGSNGCKVVTTCSDPQDWPKLLATGVLPTDQPTDAPTTGQPTDTPTTPAPTSGVGCSAAAANYSWQIGPKLWLCATNNASGGTFQHMYEACNEAGNYHLASVGPLTAMHNAGGISSIYTDIKLDAALPQVSAAGFDFCVSGQPVRQQDWDGHLSNWTTHGLAYASTSGFKQAAQFPQLYDGNCDGKRSWGSANTPDSHTLISICLDASGVANSYVFRDHIWRTSDCGNGHNMRRLVEEEPLPTDQLVE